MRDREYVPESPKSKHNRGQSEDMRVANFAHSETDGEGVPPPANSPRITPEQMLGRMSIDDPDFISRQSSQNAVAEEADRDVSNPPSPPAAWRALEGQDGSTMTIAQAVIRKRRGLGEGSASRRPPGVPEEPPSSSA